MAKFDFTNLVAQIKKDGGSHSSKIGVGSDLPKLTPADFIHMPKWWQDATNTLGLPFGRLVMLAGDSDSGKTTAAIQAMKAAQDQDCGIIYVETENKTSENDLIKSGVDPKGVILVKTSIIEEAYMGLFDAWDKFREKFPEDKLLVIFDSIGNVVSQRDNEIDLTEDSQKPGGKGQTNRTGLGRIVVRIEKEPKVAVLIINYTYDNIGSPGKTNAGGKSINFYSSLTYQTSRKAWVEKTVKGEKVRVGADVSWTLFKNHIEKDNPGPKKVNLRITSDGVEYTGAE